MLATKISDVLNVMLYGRAHYKWADVELSAEERQAVLDLMKERDELERDRNRLQMLLNERDQKERFRLRESPWASYHRLRKIVEKQENV